jgi:hypothetical protein
MPTYKIWSKEARPADKKLFSAIYDYVVDPEGAAKSLDTAIQEGASLTALNHFGLKPLHYAAALLRGPVVKLLVDKYGANPLDTLAGKTPRELVGLYWGNTHPIAEYLVDAEEMWRGAHPYDRVPEPNASHADDVAGRKGTHAEDAKDRKSERGPRQPGD